MLKQMLIISGAQWKQTTFTPAPKIVHTLHPLGEQSRCCSLIVTNETLRSSAGITSALLDYKDQDHCGVVLESPRGRVISLRLTDSNNKTISAIVVASCAAHELGHILGLGHASVKLELMSDLVVPAAPSTLDLYAVHLLAGGLKERTTVTLPSDIACVAVPEVLDPTVTVAAVLVFLAAVVRTRKAAELIWQKGQTF